MSDIDKAAEKFPIGSDIRYFPIRGEPEFRVGTVRSEPWKLGHGAVVVLITGTSGCVLVSHLRRAS